MRPYVDEIVLAAGAETLDACAQLADEALAPAPSTTLRHACRGDWLLHGEDAEVPSRALLEALRELARERRLTHCAVTRRWLYRDPATYLCSPPWQPDYQPRLVRTGATEAGERRLVDLPVYGAELLLVPEPQRRVRALAQERLRPEALRDGAPASAMLVPEDWKGLVVEAVPRPERAAIAHAIDPAAPPPSAHDSSPARGRRAGGAVAGEAAITFVRPVTRMPAGLVREQEVLVSNACGEPWPWRRDGDAPIRLGYRWRAAGGPQAVLGEGPRTPFTETVEPGRCSLACLTVEAPPAAGRYVLEVDVVHEHVRWFGCAARLEVEVEGPDGGRSGAPPGRRAYLAQARTHGLDPREALRSYRRWAAGRRDAATPLSDGRPWLTFAAQDALEQELDAGTRVCEFGAGGSTRFALERGAAVVTIEWDADWAARVGDAIAPERRAAWTLELVAPEPDEAAATLDPSDPASYVSASPAFSTFSFRAYAQAVERFADGAFDLVLVAGRARPSCLRHALAKVAPGGLLVLDHSERPWYEPALALAGPARWTRTDHRGPGPYAERFWQTTILRRAA